MKALKTKVILSAFVLLFALVATIGSTYAWFTVSSVVSVDTMNIDVTTEESLLIKVVAAGDDAEVEAQDIGLYNFGVDDFVNNINNATLAVSYPGLATGAGSPYLMTPVTAAAGETAGLTNYASFNTQAFRDIVLGSLGDATRTYTSPTANQTGSGSFIELRFWLMVQSGTGITVELNTLTATSTPTEVAQSVYLATYAETETNQKVFPIHSDWDFTFVDGDTGYRSTTAINAIPDSGTALVAFEETAGAGTTAVTLTANIPEIVSVYIWIEGWDAESTNYIMGESFDIDFSFAIFS